MPLLLSQNCCSLSSKSRNGREVTAIPVRVTKWHKKPTFFTLVAKAPHYLCERKRLQPKTSHLTFTLRQCLERAIPYLQYSKHWHDLTGETHFFFFGPRSFMSSKNTWENTLADRVQQILCGLQSGAKQQTIRCYSQNSLLFAQEKLWPQREADVRIELISASNNVWNFML
jgi:hypothetical protein